MVKTPQSAFMRPGKLVLLLLLVVIVYVVTLALWVPAGWIWAQAKSHITLPPQLQVQQVSGTIWSGAASAVFMGKFFRLEWQPDWPSAFKLPVDIAVGSADSSLKGRVLLGWPLSVELDARGVVHVAEFDDLIRQSEGIMLDGDVTVERMQIHWADNRLREAQGLASWPGGGVSWPVGDRWETSELPPMELTLQSEADELFLMMVQQGQQVPAAEAVVLANGTLEVQVYKRLIDLAGQPWSGAASPDDVVFRLRQPLLPTGRF